MIRFDSFDPNTKLKGSDIDATALAAGKSRASLTDLAYNTLGLPLAAGALYPATGWLLNPMFAGAAMSLSSITVVANALRLRHARL